jgi:predicted transcriptional regulator
MKDTSIHIRISVDKLNLLKIIAKKEYRKVTAIIDRAIDNFLKAKKIIKG